MFHSLRYFFLVLLTIVIAGPLQAQQDPLRPITVATDTVLTPLPAPGSDVRPTKHMRDSVLITDAPLPHSPRKAALYSAVLPGFGQAYNREYWKIPLVYAALGTCTYFFIDNMKLYKSFRDAYRIRLDGNPNTVDEYAGRITDAEGLKQYRHYYRQNLDYSVLFFVLAYGLNIADATVFAHLRTFDMSSDLSMHISPTLINNRTLGIGVNISIGGKKASSRRYFAGR